MASPATVSRCGMVYNDYIDMRWRPFVDSWLQKKKDKTLVEELRRLCEKYIERIFEFVNLNCVELIPIPELNGVMSLCKLFDSLAIPENGVSCFIHPLSNNKGPVSRSLKIGSHEQVSNLIHATVMQ